MSSTSPRVFSRIREPVHRTVLFSSLAHAPRSYVTILKIIALVSPALTIFGVLVSRRRYMRMICLFYRFLKQARAAAARLFLMSCARSAMSLLLAIQIYVAQVLSSNPSHLENAANDAYVGSRVSCAAPPPLFAWVLTVRRAEQRQPAARHRICERAQAACGPLPHHPGAPIFALRAAYSI